MDAYLIVLALFNAATLAYLVIRFFYLRRKAKDEVRAAARVLNAARAQWALDQTEGSHLYYQKANAAYQHAVATLKAYYP